MYGSTPVQGRRCAFRLNGDIYNDFKTVTVNSHQTPHFDVFCDQLAKVLSGNQNGFCIRNIYTPTNGTRITDLEKLESGNNYIASPDKFTKIRYREIPPRKPRHLQLTRSGYRKIDINRPIVPTKHPKDPRLRDKQGKACAQNEQVKGLRIFVHIWGQEEDPPHKINIGFKQRNRLVFIKKIISDTLFVHEDSPLYKFDYGVQKIEEVTEPSELETNDVVLVVNSSNARIPRELILRDIIQYTPTGRKPLVVHNVTPRNAPYYNYEPFPAPQDNRSKRKWQGKYRPLPSIGSSSKQSGPISPYSNPPSQGGRKHNSNRSRPAKQIDYDEDKGGVYRAKGQDNSRGANQVNDTRDTRTERPIDQMEAEEVEEEEFPSKEKTTPIPPGTELNKKPSKEQKQDKDVKKEKKSEEKINEDTNEGKRHDQWDDSFEQADRTNNARSSTPASVREARHRDELKQQEAATRIQAGVRGMNARKDIEKKKKEKRQQDDIRREEERRRYEDEERRKDHAATKIQAGFKGYKVRKTQQARKQGQ